MKIGLGLGLGLRLGSGLGLELVTTLVRHISLTCSLALFSVPRTTGSIYDRPTGPTLGYGLETIAQRSIYDRPVFTHTRRRRAIQALTTLRAILLLAGFPNLHL